VSWPSVTRSRYCEKKHKLWPTTAREVTVSTAALDMPPAQETTIDIGRWRREIARTYARSEIVPGGRDFSGCLHTFDSDGLRVTRLTASDHVVHRLDGHIAADHESRIVLGVQVSGHGTMIQDGRIADLAPGDAALYDTSRPYTLTFDEPVTCLSVGIPRDRRLLAPQVATALTAVRLPGSDPVAAAVTGAISGLETGLPLLPTVTQQRAARTITDMVEMLCLHVATLNDALVGDTRIGDLEQVLRFVDEHLDDPELGPQMVAAAHFLSLRALYGLAQAGGIGIAGWIRRRRLERCRDDLANPALRSMSVAEIGARWGLVHPAHFCTLFHNEFGTTPGAYRDSVLRPR
jgi:AraC-like DNA-binding protein